MIPITLLALVAAAIGVAALLIGRTGPGRQLIDQASLPDPIAAVVDPVRVTAVTPFDPNGSGTPGENNQEAPLVIDGHSATGWHTEGYNTRRFGNLKSGLGLDLTLERSTGIDRLEVVSPTRGWSAAIYVSDQGGPTLADWGSPVTEKSGIDGNATFALQGAKGRHVLVWITDLGDGPPLVTAEIDEILIRR